MCQESKLRSLTGFSFSGASDVGSAGQGCRGGKDGGGGSVQGSFQRTNVRRIMKGPEESVESLLRPRLMAKRGGGGAVAAFCCGSNTGVSIPKEATTTANSAAPVKRAEAEEGSTVAAKKQEAGVQSAVSASQAQRKVRLKEAKELYDEGLIDLADYNTKKAEILSSL